MLYILKQNGEYCRSKAKCRSFTSPNIEDATIFRSKGAIKNSRFYPFKYSDAWLKWWVKPGIRRDQLLKPKAFLLQYMNFRTPEKINL